MFRITLINLFCAVCSLPLSHFLMPLNQEVHAYSNWFKNKALAKMIIVDLSKNVEFLAKNFISPVTLLSQNFVGHHPAIQVVF